MMGHRGSRGLLLDYMMWLNVMTASEVQWTLFSLVEIHEVRFSTYYSLLAYCYVIEPYMPKRCVRQFGQTQGVPYAPEINPIGHCRPASTKSYIVNRNFTRAFLEDATSHYVHSDHMRHIYMPLYACRPHYMKCIFGIQRYRIRTYFLPVLISCHVLSH